jgi:hypothetical protein
LREGIVTEGWGADRQRVRVPPGKFRMAEAMRILVRLSEAAVREETRASRRA